jgi:hypothetical protein
VDKGDHAVDATAGTVTGSLPRRNVEDMGRKKKGAPVVITRKDKKLFKTGHLAAFALTGGAAGIYTAGKAATTAGYNARTRKLQAESEEE